MDSNDTRKLRQSATQAIYQTRGTKWPSLWDGGAAAEGRSQHQEA